MSVAAILALVIAPVAIFIFTLVTAYVLKFGIRRSGINMDYALFALFVIAALVLAKAV